MPESKIAAWLATQQDAMVAMPRDMVDIDSASYNKPGIDAVGATIRRFMASQDIPVGSIPPNPHPNGTRQAWPDPPAREVPRVRN